jgi:hypothetical protein
MSFVLELRDLIRWADEDAVRMDKDDILDAMRTKVLTLLQKFVAYPHCDNFSLMADAQ